MELFAGYDEMGGIVCGRKRLFVCNFFKFFSIADEICAYLLVFKEKLPISLNI